ncbi:MAG TPA: hypothetical protein VGT24_13215 [Candidatus Acidoferrales bacterium]|nr:hypothetical protein [Candidatus Acidoferrales bacterium]
MSQDAMKQMEADENLKKDISHATSAQEIQSLLENAMARSGIADRDPESGRFIRRDPLTPANQTVVPEEEEHEHVISKTVEISGREFTFSGSSESDLDAMIENARVIVEATEATQPEPGEVTARSARIQRGDSALDAARKAELELAFKRGEIDTVTYLRESGAISQTLQEMGFDVEQAADRQYETSWAEGTQEFLNGPGSDWPGGNRNLQIMSMKLQELGLTEAEDKVAALTAAYAELKKAGTIFEGDVSPEQIVKATEGMTPQQILEEFKEAHGGDSEAANQAFIEAHRGGRIGSSSIFGK